jgi:hypothetical protein
MLEDKVTALKHKTEKIDLSAQLIITDFYLKYKFISNK